MGLVGANVAIGAAVAVAELVAVANGLVVRPAPSSLKSETKSAARMTTVATAPRPLQKAGLRHRGGRDAAEADIGPAPICAWSCRQTCGGSVGGCSARNAAASASWVTMMR